MDRRLLNIRHSALGVASMVMEDSFSFPACLAHKTDTSKESSGKKKVKSEGTFNLLS